MSCSPARLVLSSALAFLLTGCGATLPHITSAPIPSSTFTGRVHGGEQPVSGALIQLYTVGTTADGSAATPLLTSTVTTDSNGNFNITNLYSCSAATEVYLVATGGNPGLSGPNPSLALMTALGPCANLTPQSFISVNELITVAAVYALQPFFTDAAHVGSAPTDANGLAAAFTLANQLVSSATGAILSNSGNTTQLNTLADILAACVNTTGGVAGDPSVCGRLFTLTTSSSGTAPTDTLSALFSIGQNPTSNTAQLYGLVPPLPLTNPPQHLPHQISRSSKPPPPTGPLAYRSAPPPSASPGQSSASPLRRKL